MKEREIAKKLYKMVEQRDDIGLIILELLADTKDLSVEKIIEEYKKLKTGEIKVVDIFSSITLTDEQKPIVEKNVKQLFPKDDLIFDYTIDENLSGLMIKIEDNIIDLTIDNLV